MKRIEHSLVESFKQLYGLARVHDYFKKRDNFKINK